MASFPKINAYTRNQPEAILSPSPIVALRAPTTHDISYPLGQLWVFKTASSSYILTSVVANTATWALISAGGALNVNGDTEINTSGSAPTNIGTGTNTGVVTIGNSSSTAVDIVGPTFINFSANNDTSINTGTSTGAVNIGNATGNVTIPAGNLIIAGTGAGLKVPPVIPTAGASPLVASGRFGVVAFTNVINAAATAALAITNTVSTGTSRVFATVQCATVGSACIIRNIDVSVPGTITVNVTNLGGTNTAANVVVTFWVMN